MLIRSNSWFKIGQNLPHTDPRVLQDVYRSWCKDGIIHWKDGKESPQSSCVERDLLLDSYFYGLIKGNTVFQDAVVDAIFQQSTKHPQLLLKEKPVDRVYKGTEKGDVLRDVLIKIIVFRLPLGSLDKLLASVQAEEFHDEFWAASQLSESEREKIYQKVPGILLDVKPKLGSVDSIRLKRGWQELYPWVADPCQFHQHGPGNCPVGSSRRPGST